MINRRRNGAWVSALILASAAAAPTYAVNLLVNAGFEGGPTTTENTTANPWVFVPTAKRVNFFNHTSPNTGYSIWARTWEISGSPFPVSGVYQDVGSITTGANYTFSSWVYAEPNFGTIPDEGVDLRLTLSWLDASSNAVGSPTELVLDNSVVPASVWTQYSVAAAAPAGAAKARVFMGWDSPGGISGPSLSAFFDDAVLDGPGVPPVGASWDVDGSGDWNIPANWTSGTVPNAVGEEVFFGAALTASHTVYTDIPVTVGTMTFENANTYVISGAGSLTLSVASGGAGINVNTGSHKINLPLIIASNTTASVASGATLTLADPVTIKAGKSLTRAGSGSLLIQAPLTIETGGTLSLGAGPMTVFSAPSLQGTARVNVGTQLLTVDYRGQASPAATIKAQITTGYNLGAWNGSGIMSGNTNSQKGVGWVDDPTTQSIKVKMSYYGDANLDGQVNSADFNAFVAGYGQTANGNWQTGDFDYNGKVNTRDFNRLAANFGAAPLPAPDLGAVVPEPMSASLVALTGLLVAGRRRRD